MSRLGAAAETSGWVLAGKGIERLLRIAVVVVLARLLEARGFGVYSFAFAFAEMFAVLTDLGLHPILVREIARDRAGAPRLLGGALVLKAFLAAGSWLAACAVAVWTVPAGEPRWSALAASLILFVSFRVASLRWVFEAPFEAGLRMAAPASIGVASELFSAACLLAAAWARWPIPALIGVQVAALLPGCLLLWRACSREIRPVMGFDPALWRRLLGMALPVGAANLFIMAYSRSDLLMLEWMAGSASVGMYAAAYKLVGSLDVFPHALTTSLLPLMSAAFAQGDAAQVRRLYRGALSLAAAAGLAVGMGGSLLAPGIVGLVYGAGYAPAAGAMRILAWAALFHFLLYVMTTAALAAGRERLFTAYAGLLALLNVLLNALLIPRFGIVGASWATFIAEGIMLGAGVAVLRPSAGAPEGGPLLRACAAAAAAGAILLWLPAPLLLRLAAAAVLYPVLLHWGRALPPEAAGALRHLLRAGWRGGWAG